MQRRKSNQASLLSNPFKLLRGVKKGKETGKLGKLSMALQKESELAPVLHQEAGRALQRLKAADPSLEQLLRRSFGYAIFPRIGKVSAVLGSAFGLGEVRVNEQVIGYAALLQATVGLQVGKQLYQELIVFGSAQALEEFKRGETSFSANASAVVVKAGSATTARRKGAKVFVRPISGVGVEAGIGGQKFIFKPAAIGRVRSAFEPAKAALRENLSHLGKATNPNVIPRGAPQVPIRRSSTRGTPGWPHK